MYEVEFYEDANGVSELWDFLEELRVKSATNKDARIQHKQIALYIQLLQDSGTRLPENITKHLVEDIWELRPAITGCFTSVGGRINLYCCISSERNRRRHLEERSSARKRNGMIGLQEIRSDRR